MREWSNKQLVEYIVMVEFESFDRVKGIGGRASCQDDWKTFYIMRASQYLTWTRDLLISYLNDFQTASEKGWNMITEKYARMMETTDKERFNEFKDSLPPISEKKKAIIEEVVKIQVAWMEEFTKEYPQVSPYTRYIHTTEDTIEHTSYETYLRGELSTYSDHTLYLYARFIVELMKEKKNLAKMTMEHTIHMYGYQSFDEITWR